MWGATRPASIALLTMTLATFSIGLIFDLPWQIGWSSLFIALAFEIVQSVHDLKRHCYIFDAPLFCLGILVFTVLDPIYSIIVGAEFPGPNDTVYIGNQVSNIAGLVITTFSLSFFVGRTFVSVPNLQEYKVVDSNVDPKFTALHILVLALAVSIAAFLLNGGNFGIENISRAILARSEGYVAFSSSGLGTEDPVVKLLGQSIPTAIVLWIISISRKRPVWSAFATLVSAILFTLYVLVGGRSGIIFILLTIWIYLIVRKNAQLRLFRLSMLTGLTILILAFQTNFRDKGTIGSRFFEYSPLRGFALNREVAFIVNTYGEDRNFVRGPGIIDRIALPLPDTIAVFFTNPIPRIYWSDKPIDPSFGPYNELRTGRTGFGATTNITPTIPGRYYISYGFWGVIQIGLVFGFLWRLFDRGMTRRRYVTSRKIIVGAMLNAIMFISLRDFTFGKFYPLLYLLLFIFLSQLRLTIVNDRGSISATDNYANSSTRSRIISRM